MYGLLHLRSATSLKLHLRRNILCTIFCVHSIFHKSLFIMYVIVFYLKLQLFYKKKNQNMIYSDW